MLSVKMVVVGELREPYLRQACQEYQKRLSGMCSLSEVVIKEQRLPENPSQAEIDRALKEEAQRILPHLTATANCLPIALCVEGRQFSSEELAQYLEKRTSLDGISSLVCVIGSSHGLSEQVKEKCVLRLSVSKLTFPHTMMRPLMYEILYRELAIINGKKYHK